MITNYLLATEDMNFIGTEDGDYLILYSVDDGINGDTHDGFRRDDYLKHLEHLKKIEEGIISRRQEKIDDRLELSRQLRAQPQEEAVEQQALVESPQQEIEQVTIDINNLNQQLSVIVWEIIEYNAKLQLMRREHEIESLILLI